MTSISTSVSNHANQANNFDYSRKKVSYNKKQSRGLISSLLSKFSATTGVHMTDRNRNEEGGMYVFMSVCPSVRPSHIVNCELWIVYYI